MESHGGNVELLGVERRRSRGSASRAAATAARPRRRRSSWRSSRRSTRPRPTSRGWSSRARSQTPAPADTRARGARAAGRAGRDRRSRRPVRRRGSTSTGSARSAEGELAGAEVHGTPLVVARVEGNLLAFRDSCAGCGSSLARPSSARARSPARDASGGFFLPRAGPLARRRAPAARAGAAARRRRPGALPGARYRR